MNRLAGWIARLAAVALIGASAACGGQSASSPSVVGPTAPLPSLDVMLADKVMGSPSASVTIIEYSSLTCSHCAAFQTATLPQLRTAYLDTGRARLIYRDFPLDGASMSASMIARCSGDRFFAVIDLLYRAQDTWTRASDVIGALKQTVAPAGMTAGDVDTCLAQTALRDGIAGIYTAGQAQYGIRAVPTFIIDSRKIEGALPFADFDAILKSLIQ